MNDTRAAEAYYLRLAVAGADGGSLHLAQGLFAGKLVAWLNYRLAGTVSPEGEAAPPVGQVVDVRLLRAGVSEATATPKDLIKISVTAASMTDVQQAPAVQKLAGKYYPAEIVPLGTYSRLQSVVETRAREAEADAVTAPAAAILFGGETVSDRAAPPNHGRTQPSHQIRRRRDPEAHYLEAASAPVASPSRTVAR